MTREVSRQFKVLPATSLLALALGAAAFGAVAIGALAIGRLLVGRLVIKKARFGALEVDELTVRRLRVVEHERPNSDALGRPIVLIFALIQKDRPAAVPPKSNQVFG
jgi:hypothetical protein